VPKSLPIHPNEVRQSGQLAFTSIPINQYNRSLQDEQLNYTSTELVGLYRDMAMIRTFETLLDEIKKSGSYRGIAYNHRGPAHLSIGQEASAVGQAFLLGVDDAIFGSHRSHGEILAKGLSAISKLDDAALLAIMESYNDGAILKAIGTESETESLLTAGTPAAQSCRIAGSEIKKLAIDFLLYGALAEIFGRETGFNRGMGGSMHAFFTPFGIYPNNALVGGSADIATGAALYKRLNRKPGLVICNIGDAAASCGPVWEALCFATMEQFKTLFEAPYRGGLPLIFNFVNNFYGMGGQPVGETGGFGVLARIGAGLNPEQMHAERIDGYNPLAVIDAIRRKREIIERGDGPVLLDTVTYRISGHSPSDASSYRDRSEVEAWERVDSLRSYGEALMTAGLCTSGDLERMQAEIDAAVLRAFVRAIDPDLSPRADLYAVGNLLERTMFSNRRVVSLAEEREPDVLLPRAANPRVKRLAGRNRSGLRPDGERLPKAHCIGIRDALFEAILDRFHADPTLVAYGEENRDWGGAFGVYAGLTESLPYHRLFNSPIAEAAIVGTAVGYGLSGGRALVELMYCDFLGRAGDEAFNQLAKWQSMSGGDLIMPVTVRVSVGSKYGAQHSQDWTALCAHIPGLKVVFPATPYDAKGLLNAALTGTDPVIFFESQRIYDQPELFHGLEGVPEGYYEVPIGEPEVKRTGNDLTILTVGATLYRALEAADALLAEHGLAAEVIDARSLVPFNYTPLIESVHKTGRLLLAGDACERGSFLHTLATRVMQLAFDALDAPPVVVGARNWITPPDELEESFFPTPADLLDAIHTDIVPLPGYSIRRPCNRDELLRRNRQGI
jgi:2-oxoisovalerate dehydrogenase E1 component